MLSTQSAVALGLAAMLGLLAIGTSRSAAIAGLHQTQQTNQELTTP